jgi:hypothetical protein
MYCATISVKFSWAVISKHGAMAIACNVSTTYSIPVCLMQRACLLFHYNCPDYLLPEVSKQGPRCRRLLTAWPYGYWMCRFHYWTTNICTGILSTVPGTGGYFTDRPIRYSRVVGPSDTHVPWAQSAGHV